MSMTIPKDNKEFVKRFVDVVFNCDIQYEMDSDDLTRIEKETYKQLKHKNYAEILDALENYRKSLNLRMIDEDPDFIGEQIIEIAALQEYLNKL